MVNLFQLQNVNRNKVIEMLSEEQKIRYSPKIQKIYTKAYEINQLYGINNVNIEREIQKFILRKFGYDDSYESLEEYWKIPSTYWNDEEVKNTIFYMKLNIFTYGKLQVEDNMIDVDLIDYNTNEIISLSSLQTNKPLVILAGSLT